MSTNVSVSSIDTASAEDRAPIGPVGQLDWFYLAGRTLTRGRVVSLLLSSSFGINAVVYAAWLGYMMGLWAVVVQIGWAFSFVLLSVFARRVYAGTGIHDLVGRLFGPATKKVAALFSAIGLIYFVGWEIAIGQGALTSLVPVAGGVTTTTPSAIVDVIVALAVLVAITYTFLRGQRGNSYVDGFLNLLKVVLLIALVVALLITRLGEGADVLAVILPSPQEAIGAIGPWGLATTLIFNLAWQFVDNSSWQSISSYSRQSSDQVARTMRWTALWVFGTIGLFGTLLGSLLRGLGDVNSDDLFYEITKVVVASPQIVAWGLILLIALSVVSLIDGVILSVSQTVVVDMGLQKVLRASPLVLARLMVVVIGLFAAWGVNLVINWLGGSLFDFVYVLVVAQLTLFGPVIMGLTVSRRTPNRRPMWLAIVLAGCAGILATLFGGWYGISALIDGAGTITVAVSTLMAVLLSAPWGTGSGRALETHAVSAQEPGR